MIVTPYKTPKITEGADLFATLDEYLPKLKENDIVVVTSKIVSICQGRIIKNDGQTDKKELSHKESDFYIDNDMLSRWGVMLTIKNDILIATSGIDESNGNGYFILWPENLTETTKNIWEHLKQLNKINHLGVIITDSRVTPMRWGTLGVGISWCGFEPLNNYIDTPDIFGRNLHATKSSILDGLAASAVLVMGEGSEQTPLALIEDVPFVHFQTRPPTGEEITSMRIAKEDDIYAPLTDSPLWKKGGPPAGEAGSK